MQDSLGAVQSVLVLGGGSEIALATVRRLVHDRTRTVVLAARNPDELTAVTRELRDLGATTVAAVEFDAADTDSHDALVDECFDRFGDFDMVLFAFGVLADQAEAERDSAVAA